MVCEIPIKLKSSAHQKTVIKNEEKEQTNHRLEESNCKTLSDKGPVSKTYVENPGLNNKKQSN